jgi:hypothetical protein
MNMNRTLLALALLLVSAAARAVEAGPPAAKAHPEWETIFNLRVRSGLELSPEDWMPTYQRIMTEGCKGESEETCREFQQFFIVRIQDLVRDPGRDDRQRTRIVENTMHTFCRFVPGPDCDALLAAAAELAGDDGARAEIAFLSAEHVQGTDRNNPDLAERYLAVGDQYPASDAAAKSIRALQQLCDQGLPGASAAVDPKRLAEVEDKFIRANPRHEKAGAILLDLSSRSGASGRSVSQLRAVAEVYRAANPESSRGPLGHFFQILDNLAHPWRSLGGTGLIFLAPILIFALALRRFYHPEDPGRGPLTPRRVKVLFWILSVLLMPIAVVTMLKLCPGEVLLIHFFGRPLELSGRGEFQGQNAIAMVMMLAPVAVLMVMTFSLKATALTQGEAPRDLPWWLPQDYARLLIGLWLGIGGGCALTLYLLFGGDYVFASMALAVSLMVPLFNGSIALISRLYGAGPMPEGPVRGFIRETFTRCEVRVKEIHNARSSLKMIEWLLVANLCGPVRCYLDPELLKRFTKNEFQAVILHQIGHLKGGHRLKLTGASSAVAAAVLALILVGSLVPMLHFLIPGLFVNLMVGAAIIGLSRWERLMEREADQFVIDRTGLFQDHINAILKLAGLDPASVDLRRIQESAALRPETKRRVLFILERWYQAQVWTLPKTN